RDRSLGWAFPSWRAGATARHGLRFFDEHNLLFRGGFAWGAGLPFTEEMEAGGGGLRGFNYREFRGDTTVDGHIEYYIPIVWAFSTALRGLLFYDTQAIWFRRLDTSRMTAAGTYAVRHSDGSVRTYLPEISTAGPHPPHSRLD